jgi:hypothetical protein
MKSFAKGMAIFVPTRMPIWSMMPLSTPAYFLYLSGQISKDWIKAPSILLDKKVTCDDTIGNGEEELDQVGEDVVVDQ